MAEPNVSVIIPSYNLGKYIGEAIESVLNQTYQNYELIIVDDASSDASVDIIKTYCKKDKRIKSYYFKENKGACEAFNYGLSKAKGKYICYMGADDVFLPDKLEIQFNFLEENPQFMAVFGLPEFIDENGNILNDIKWINPNYKSRYEYLRHFFYYGSCLAHPSVMIRRKMYNEFGFLDNRFYQLPDFDLWIKICMKYEIFVLERIVYKNRIRGNSNASGINVYSYQRNCLEFAKILHHYTSINNIDDLYNIFPDLRIKFINVEKALIPLLIAYQATQVDSVSHAIFYYNIFFEYFENKHNINRLKKYGFSYKTFWFPFSTSISKLLEREHELYKIKNSYKYRIASKFEKIANILQIRGLIIKIIKLYMLLKKYINKKKLIIITMIFIKIIKYFKYYFKYTINKKNKKYKILLVIDGKYPSVYLCAIYPLKYLEKNNKLLLTILREDNISDYDIKMNDIVLFLRNRTQASFEIFKMAKKEGKKAIYAIDDNFEELPYNRPIKNKIDLNILKKFYIESHAVITYSEYFKNVLKKYNKNIYNVSNLSNHEIIENLKTRVRVKKKVGKIIVGYFSSDKDNIEYINMIKPSLIKILDEYKETIELHLINIPRNFIGAYKNVKYYNPIFSLDKFYKFMIKQQWDVGLAPLIDTEFNRCKTDNKYREYAALRIAGIYSNIIPYKNSVKNNITGILVENDDELWYKAIKELIENKDKRIRIIEESYNDVKERYSLEKYSDNYYQVFKKILEV